MKKIILILIFLSLTVLKAYCFDPPYIITVINSCGAVNPNQGFNLKDLRYNVNASCIVGTGGPWGGGANQIYGHVEDGLNGGTGWMLVFSNSCTQITPYGHLPGDPVFRIKFYCYHICSGTLQIQYDQCTKQFSILPSSTMLASDYSSPCSECDPKEINSANNANLVYSQNLTESDDWIKVSNLTTSTYTSTVTSNPNKKIKFDAKPPGFIELNPNFIASPVGSNFFLAQIVDGCGPLQPLGIIAIDQYACDSYTWPMNNVTYSASGNYSYTNVSNGDEYELNLTLGTTSSSNVNITSCDSYIWPANGLTYTASGSYHQYSINTTNCIQDEVLNLTINTGTNASTSATACNSYTWSANGNTYTASGVYSASTLNASGCLNTATLNLTITSVCNSTLNIKCYLEGYYIGGGMMTPALMNQGVSNDPTITDSITVELHDTISPYGLIASTNVLLHTNGTATAIFPTVVTPGIYYLVIKHHNGIETWSVSACGYPYCPPLCPNPVIYNFSSSASQAYGGNQIEIEPGIWAIYSGDVNQDENIDLLDLSSLDTDINNFGFGYLATDINGDGNVDLLDIPVVEANINNFIFSAHP